MARQAGGPPRLVFPGLAFSAKEELAGSFRSRRRRQVPQIARIATDRSAPVFLFMKSDEGEALRRIARRKAFFPSFLPSSSSHSLNPVYMLRMYPFSFLPVSRFSRKFSTCTHVTRKDLSFEYDPFSAALPCVTVCARGAHTQGRGGEGWGERQKRCFNLRNASRLIVPITFGGNIYIASYASQ